MVSSNLGKLPKNELVVEQKLTICVSPIAQQ